MTPEIIYFEDYLQRLNDWVNNPPHKFLFLDFMRVVSERDEMRKHIAKLREAEWNRKQMIYATHHP